MSKLSIGHCATLACILEATAPKPGNVHRGADFEDVTYLDFILSAVAIGPVFDAAPGRRLGETVLAAIEATRNAVGTNTNLGTVLLLAPLAMVPRDVPLSAGLPTVLAMLNRQDATDVYAAICLAQPGGMGHVAEADISGKPPDDLLTAMRLAASHDRVARQYAENFADVLGVALPLLTEAIAEGRTLFDAIVLTHLQLMQRFPDSLIARKCGMATAERAAAWAGQVLSAGRPGDEAFDHAVADLDFWLRSDGHRRNPGATADLVAAGLFAALRDGIIIAPFR